MNGLWHRQMWEIDTESWLLIYIAKNKGDREMKEELEKKLRVNFEDAINNFDFSKVYSVMDFLAWGWRGGSAPSQKEMIESVTKTFESALTYLGNSDFAESQCGGFSVVVCKNGKVIIEFIVESSESESYD